MIAEIIKLLNSLDFYGASDTIQFAKGAYRCPRTLKEIIKQNYRWLLQK